LGAAGAVEAIACLLAIKNGMVPPTINLENVDPEIHPQLQLTPKTAVEKEIQFALNNTFGFGGHVAVSVFKKFEGR
jgi:3-oxoacyl-[acyl-carrier-protein] synthase II